MQPYQPVYQPQVVQPPLPIQAAQPIQPQMGAPVQGIHYTPKPPKKPFFKARREIYKHRWAIFLFQTILVLVQYCMMVIPIVFIPVFRYRNTGVWVTSIVVLGLWGLYSPVIFCLYFLPYVRFNRPGDFVYTLVVMLVGWPLLFLIPGLQAIPIVFSVFVAMVNALFIFIHLGFTLVTCYNPGTPVKQVVFQKPTIIQTQQNVQDKPIRVKLIDGRVLQYMIPGNANWSINGNQVVYHVPGDNVPKIIQVPVNAGEIVQEQNVQKPVSGMGEQPVAYGKVNVPQTGPVY